MLFSKQFKAGIRAGSITRTYRIWKRPQAKAGRRYNLAPDGIIEVTGISRIQLDFVSDKDARAAGFADAAALREYLNRPEDAEAYRVDFTYQGSGLVRQPSRNRLTDEDLPTYVIKLSRMDARSTAPWTAAALGLIRAQPATRAGDLAPLLGWDTATFKRQIRKLKALGLTISLEVGYRLSPRGEQVRGLHEIQIKELTQQ